MTADVRRLAILFSGEGSTLENLVEATRDGRLPNYQVVQAISSRAGVGGIARCERLDVPCDVVAKKDYPDLQDHTRAVFDKIDKTKVDMICLAGWMSRLVLDDFWLQNRVLNIHPSLLPSFGGRGMYGRHVHEAVIARGCRVTGCTVHYVNNEIDGGPIVAQRCIPVRTDDPAELEAQVQYIERELFPSVLAELV